MPNTKTPSKDLWDNLMSYADKETRISGKIANTLTDDEIETIVATIGFFGGNVQQAVWDLKVARYRLFDFIAMGVGANGRIGSEEATKVLAYSYLKSKGNIDKFIEDLRITDYDIIRTWETL